MWNGSEDNRGGGREERGKLSEKGLETIGRFMGDNWLEGKRIHDPLIESDRQHCHPSLSNISSSLITVLNHKCCLCRKYDSLWRKTRLIVHQAAHRH